MDPDRRFLPTSSSGPRFGARAADFGKGLHWDVHGPWKLPGTMAEWIEYWAGDDALFRSETGAPGASSAEIIRRYKGDLAEMPGTADNPLWRRTSWWIEWPMFVEECGREPSSLEEFVAWSQARQAEALIIAAGRARTASRAAAASSSGWATTASRARPTRRSSTSTASRSRPRWR